MRIVGITYNKKSNVEVSSSTEDGLEVSKETTEEVGKKETKKNGKKD